MKKVVLSLLFLGNLLSAQNYEKDKMEWFSDAKFGVFIHWGIYSVNGIPESWSFYNGYTSYPNYMKQSESFSAKNYNPYQWSEIIKYSGAKYAVITSRHHDGVALWDTKGERGLSTAKHTKAKRDVLSPFIDALKKSGIKTGIYYSLSDWSHPYYDKFTIKENRYDYRQEPERFEKYINYYQTQLAELSSLYNPDLYWFDGDWEHTAEEWKTTDTRKLLLSKNPRTIINARLTNQGDYDTPEQGIPMQAPKAKYWELCYTMNDSWGYQQDDENYKSSNQLIKTLVECISMGGNLLLDIAPKEDGTIPQKQVTILKDIGRWIHKHKGAIYGTERGIPQQYFSGKTALSKDKKSLFLYLNDNQNELIWLRGIVSQIDNVEMVGDNKLLKFSQTEDDVWIEFPQQLVDKDVSVVRINFKEKINFTSKKEIKIEGNSKQKIKQLAYLLNNGKNPFHRNKVMQNDDFNSYTNDDRVNKWMKKHAEVFQNSMQKGLSESRYAGMSSLSEDGRTLYLFVDGKISGNLLVKGITNNIQRVRVVGEGSLIKHKIYDKLFWNSVPGLITVEVPKHRLDDDMTVIAIMLDGRLKEYDKEITSIEVN